MSPTNTEDRLVLAPGPDGGLTYYLDAPVGLVWVGPCSCCGRTSTDFPKPLDADPEFGFVGEERACSAAGDHSRG
jgi:hypothetical protein